MDEIEIIKEDDEVKGGDPRERINKLKERLVICEREKKEYLEGWQRSKAELINYKREEERKLHDWREKLENNLIHEFLSVMDSFDLALAGMNRKHLGVEVERGFVLIQSQFNEIMRRMGVEAMHTVGTPFDPLLHEAIEEIDSSDHGPGRVIEELQKGYVRHGKVLRPARVKVTRG